MQVIDPVADFGGPLPEVQRIGKAGEGIACSEQDDRAPETAQGASYCVSEHALLSLRPGYKFSNNFTHSLSDKLPAALADHTLQLRCQVLSIPLVQESPDLDLTALEYH